MLSSRVWVAASAALSASLLSGCPEVCETSDRAPLPSDVTAHFAVLAHDATRTEVALLDASGAPILLPTATDDDAPETTTDVWLDSNYVWDEMLAPAGVDRDARMPWTMLPGGGVTVSTTLGGRELVRLPLDESPPEELRLAPELAGMAEVAGAPLRDLAVVLGAGEDPDLVLFAQGGAIAVMERGGADTPRGGALVDTISRAGAAGDAPAAPERMVLAQGRLFVGLERYQPAPAPEQPAQVDPGAIAVVDPGGRRLVDTFELDGDAAGLVRCGELAPSLDAPADPGVERLVLSCRGVGAGVVEQAESAGVVELRIERDPDAPEREPVVTVENTWRATSHFATIPVRGLVPLPGRAVAFVSAGDVDEARDDALYVVDLDAEPVRRIRVASAPLFPEELSGLGTGAFLPEAEGTGLLVWPLGRRGVLRRRVRTVPAEGGGLDVVVCPAADEPACRPEDAALEDPVELCNRLFVDQVRRLDAPLAALP